MKTLYLFGNGFDLAHGIDTAYSSFRVFLSKNHEDFLMRFEKMYNIEPLDDTEPWYTAEAQKRWEESVLKDLWKSFEEEIGNPKQRWTRGYKRYKETSGLIEWKERQIFHSIFT